MPIKASIGLSRKVGQENYGSLGANCQLEVELDASLIGDADAFHEKIRRLYALANQAVNDQLAGKSNGNGFTAQKNDQAIPRNGNGNGNGAQEDPASNRQIKFLLDLARQRHNMTLPQTAEYCENQVGVNDVYQLTRTQASVVIDKLNGKNGKSNNGRR